MYARAEPPRRRGSPPSARLIEVPVCYGGEFGPDLARRRRVRGVCARPKSWIGLHAGATIASTWSASFRASPTWRRSSRGSLRRGERRRGLPCRRVGSDRRRADRHLSDPPAPAAGTSSAARQSKPYDAAAAEPFLFRPVIACGFAPSRSDEFCDRDAGNHGHSARDVDDDAGPRPLGISVEGVPVGGTDGRILARACQPLVGNLLTPRPRSHVDGAGTAGEAEVICAVAGRDVRADGGSGRSPDAHDIRPPTGDRLKFGARTAGARATLAVRGGFDLPAVFESRATSLISGMGPFGGRALRAGDLLPVAPVTTLITPAAAEPAVVPLPLPAGGTRLRVVAGPQEHLFTREALRHAFRLAIRHYPSVQPDGLPARGAATRACGSGRHPVGCDAARADPGARVRPAHPVDGRSTDDRAVIAKIGVVIGADLPLAGQLAPGDWIEFVWCTREAAVDALRLRRRSLLGGPR